MTLGSRRWIFGRFYGTRLWFLLVGTMGIACLVVSSNGSEELEVLVIHETVNNGGS